MSYLNHFPSLLVILTISSATASPLTLSDQIISQMITQGGIPVSIILVMTVYNYFLLNGGKK
jgi:cytochrome bd-type quinol oxidase subunit 2